MSLLRAEKQIALIRAGEDINITLGSAGENVIENLLYVQERDVSDLIVEFLGIINPHCVGVNSIPLTQRVLYHPQAERFLQILLNRGAIPNESAFCTAISQPHISEDFILTHFDMNTYPHTHHDVVNRAYTTSRKRLLRRVLDLGYPVSVMSLSASHNANTDMEEFALEILQKDTEFDWGNVPQIAGTPCGQILRMMAFYRYTRVASEMFARMTYVPRDAVDIRQALRI